VTGALRPGVVQHPAEMLSARLDHATVRVGMTRSLSLVVGDAKFVRDRDSSSGCFSPADKWRGRSPRTAPLEGANSASRGFAFSPSGRRGFLFGKKLF
jgi:hypothetical protein